MLRKRFSRGAISALWLILILSGRGFADKLDVNSLLAECTIAVFSGSATVDGRPIIWKNRDVSNHDQRFIYYDSYYRNGINTLKFVGDCYRNDTTRIYMGANEAGFAIMNSDSYNLHDSLLVGLDDGTLMRLVLESCHTLSDFETFLDSTNATGRLDCWNFGCLDSTGACAMYECANYSYQKYDPHAAGAPGYVARSNFSASGDTSNQSGLDRYQRAVNLIEERLTSDRVDAAWVLKILSRDLANIYADPYPLPYNGTQLEGPPGYIYNFGCTIANRNTSAAVVIRGVRSGEDPAYTTTFAILGPPFLSVAYPLWVEAGTVPDCLSNPGRAPMYDYCVTRSRSLYDNSAFNYFLNSQYLAGSNGGGVYSYTLPLEAWGVNEADLFMEYWGPDAPPVFEFQAAQSYIANEIFDSFRAESPHDPGTMIDLILPNRSILFNYPNPFNGFTTIQYNLLGNGIKVKGPIYIGIYDITGRLVARLYGTGDVIGNVIWAGKDASGQEVSSGIYFCLLKYGSYRTMNKMILLK